MCLYHVSTQGPCVRGLCWVWSRHGPPSCGQAHSCSSFIILTSRRDSINHNTSFANVTSLHRTLPGREPQLSCGGWADVRTAACASRTHSRAYRPQGQDPRASVCGGVAVAQLRGFLREAVAGFRHQADFFRRLPNPCAIT